MEHWIARHREQLERSERIETSLVELVVAVSELSEDGFEIEAALDSLITSGRVRLTSPI
jgi:hypothetical protein